jgi:hypothetical protein
MKILIRIHGFLFRRCITVRGNIWGTILSVQANSLYIKFTQDKDCRFVFTPYKWKPNTVQIKIKLSLCSTN